MKTNKKLRITEKFLGDNDGVPDDAEGIVMDSIENEHKDNWKVLDQFSSVVRTKFPKKLGDDRRKISEAITNKLLDYQYGGDAITLFDFYLKQRNKQREMFGVDQPWATNRFCMKGLHWGEIRFNRAKNILLELNLIEQIQEHKANGDWNKGYIKINYVWIEPKDGVTTHTTENSVTSINKGKEPNSTSKHTKNGRKHDSAMPAEQETNTLKTFNGNTVFEKTPDGFSSNKKSTSPNFNCKKSEIRHIDDMAYYPCPDGKCRNKAGAIYIP